MPSSTAFRPSSSSTTPCGLLDRKKPPVTAASSFGSDGEATKFSKVALMHWHARLLLILFCSPFLASCNSPSDYDVDVCTRNKINQRVETASGPLMCSEYVEVLAVDVADFDGNTGRAVANMRWKAKKAFGKSSETASMCFVFVRDPGNHYQADEIIVSKVNVELEQRASSWKCKS
jgi:hypothetical protein